jgi:hypothetical protein
VAALAAAAVVLGSAAAAASAAPVLPEFSVSNFTPAAPIDNPYNPLVPGTTYRETATVTDPDTGETGFQVDENLVTFNLKTIAGVPARVVRARSFLDGQLIEDTDDYFAQDKSGNVWYMGEDTKAFEYDDEGNLVATDTSGSWHAGVHGASPGFIMPANPTVGMSYFQEFAPQDQAQDQARILSLTETVTVPVGTFSNVIKTEETSPLEPDTVENKFYARGVGEIQVFEDIQDNGQPLNTFTLQSVTHATAIPLPPALLPGLFGLAGAFALVARKRRRAG